MKLKTIQQAIEWQHSNESYNRNGINQFSTSVPNIDLLQFSLGNVLWLVLADDYYLDDYEESVIQYGITPDGRWAAVYGGHCSCYGWEDMSESEIIYYESLEVLLKADKNAVVILRYWNILTDIMPFLKKYLRKNSKLFREF